MRFTNRAATLCTLALLFCLSAPSLVMADPITPGDGWHAFSWSGAPNVFQIESPFTFTSATPVDLAVTDAFVSGDRFEVYDFGSLVGITSQINGIAPWTSDPDTAFLSGQFSTGVFSLSAGSHSLTFKNVQAPTGHPGGTAFFRVDPLGVVAQVPEPASLTLVALGAAGLALGRYRQRKNKQIVDG